jgi:flagellar motility protein MotE (MotC chaperone)
MKNLLILGLTALLLFSVSASLSLWLNQSRLEQGEKDKEKDKDKDKAGAKGPKGGDPKEVVEPRDKPKDVPPPPSGGTEYTIRELRDREAKLEQRAARVELVIRDIQSQREATESKLRQVMAELKNVSTDTGKLDALAADLQKKKVEFEAAEKKNVEKIAAMYDTMAPESSAPIIKQMAESGRMDMAAKILVTMKERNAARVLEAVNDPALAFQILEKMRGLRPTPPAIPPKLP